MMNLGRIALVTGIVVGGTLAGTATASAAGVGELGPTPEICNVFAPTPNCFYAAVSGTDTFNLGGHLFFKGQELSGTYRWEIGGQGAGEFPSFGAVTVLAGGPGLKLIRCRGPRGASNADAKWRSPQAFDITKGRTTCTWRAVGATNAWVNGPGLAVVAGGQNYTAGDFYAVLSNGAAIDGHVTEQNVQKKLQDYTGIAGATVRISGPGFRKQVTTSDTGYYDVIVPRGGTYTVTPSVPRSYFKGSTVKREAEPKFAKVRVREDDTSTADFTYKSSLKLTLKLDQTSVPADGMSSVGATVTATDGGAPVQNLTISLRPFGGGSALQSPFSLTVPATICSVSGTSVGGRVWPDPNVQTPNTDSVDITTDATGQVSLRVYTGTVPGTFPLSVWAKGEDGKLIAQNASQVSDDADIKVTALTDGGDPPAALHNWVNLPNNASLAGSLPTDVGSLVGTLGTAIHSANLRSAFVLTPVQTPKGYQGLLMSPEGSRIKFDPATGVVDPSSTGFLLTPNDLNGRNLYAGGFWGYIKTTGTPAEFATLPQWLAGSAPGYSYPGNAGPITLLNASRLQYAGFGYGPACT